ncbi:MAG: hypothetical protein C5B48_11260 [Candidatus Rokuibacteriota bacterium]|nr:MAG: hypothetical protein C5B48_11260 [Candidatus Rokubacteria bacterium]
MGPLPRLGAALVMAGLVLSFAGSAGAAFPGNNGKIAFSSSRDGDYEIYSMNPDGSNQTRLTRDVGSDIDPAWSPDGQKIAFTSNRAGPDDIYVMNQDGGSEVRLTTSPGDDENPAWSPGGRDIAFASTRDGNAEIYVMNEDGTGQSRLTTNSASDLYPAWSPNGQQIAFESNREGAYQIYVMNVDGSGQTRLTSSPGDNISPAWSPDGQKIAFASNRDGNYEIYFMNADGSAAARLTHNTAGDLDPAWSPDGQKIAFTSDRDGNLHEIYVMNADGSDQTRLTTNAAEDTTPDWQSLVIPPTAVKTSFFTKGWRESVYHGKLHVDGHVDGPATISLTLRRGTRVYLPTTTLDLPPGDFQRELALPVGLLPTSYTLAVGTADSQTPLSPQQLDVTLPPPLEGVVGGAYVSTAMGGVPAKRFPRRTSIVWAQFRFVALPRQSVVRVSWYGPKRIVRSVGKRASRIVVSYLGTELGPPLPAGSWRCVVRASGRVVKRVAFRIG